MWVCGAGYLSFLFIDGMMSRWLMKYTPQATLVRLFAINCICSYLTSQIMRFFNTPERPRMLLPSWILIVSLLTFAYHITQRKMKEREVWASMSVFTVASFITMIILLIETHLLTKPIRLAPGTLS
ncbi:hypothetical protein BJ508DRAFT_90473 [Ascobolus immersus RN42]|uniref:Uncharacterized protein n=1 Tax=Ascobolus immersus RN42 TaxID=1160509 RepID=A0A3N4I879_ASCIM|nr:hypothetical protein BJ508DRAFT_90473 [Ascobolus immersus RN42]